MLDILGHTPGCLECLQLQLVSEDPWCLFVFCSQRLLTFTWIQFWVIFFLFLSLLFLFVQLPLYSLPSLGCRRARWDVFSKSEAREWPFSCQLVVLSLLVIKNPGSVSNSLLWLTQSRLYSAVCSVCAEPKEDFRTRRCLFNLCVYCCCASFLFLQVLFLSFWGSGVKATDSFGGKVSSCFE